MLLTFLGLTLAATTSTELQIATNYRWSQQALYNAEAGLEAARIILSRVADVNNQWSAKLPPARTTPTWWAPGPTRPGPTGPSVGRDYERSACDERAGVGYGRVLTEGTVRYENVASFAGQTLNGAFTIWIRRDLVGDNAGQFADSPLNDVLTVVAEGVAPFTGPFDAFTRSRQATRVLETRYTLSLAAAGDPCLGAYAGQEGGSPFGENFYGGCAPITAGRGGSLENAFGDASSGDLSSTGVN
jgi:hypothetical protein